MKTRFSSPRPQVMACCVLVVTLACLALTTSVFAAGPAPAQSAPSGPKIWLQDSRPMQVAHVGPAAASMSTGQPLSMVSADFDADGVQDLVVGYSTPSGGVLAIHRGNLDAFAPQSEESFQAIGRSEFPSPFLPEAQTFAIPVNPDFIAAGNFAGLGNTDLVVAARGGNVLYVFAGDGKGNFARGQTINLPGGVTSLAAGALGNSLPGSDLIVGVSGRQQTFLAVYASGPKGLAPIAAFPLSAPASNILFGDFGSAGDDVAFLAGGKVQILRSSPMQLVSVSLPVPASAMALGRFVYDRNPGVQIALLSSDGSIQIAARNEFNPRVYTAAEFNAIRQARRNNQPVPLAPARSFPVNGWKIVESLPSVGSVAAGQPVFLGTRISNNGADDVMWLNASGTQMVVVSHPDSQLGAVTFLPGQVSVKPYNGSPVAGMPMRLNVDGRPGVVALHRGETTPSLSLPIPDPNFFVNKDTDPTPTSPIANACTCTTGPSCFTDLTASCSLREAILKANGDTINLQAGHTYSLTIGRGATQDYSGNTGALYVNKSVTIVGGNQNTTIIQWGTPGTGTVDMVMAVNQDINSPFTNATASLSNLTIQNGTNHGTVGTFDGDGGCMEFDTGLSGNNTLTLTSVTLQNCATTDGNGGGLASFNTNNGTGMVTITTNSIIQNNSVKQVTGGATGTGGGIWVSDPSRMSMSNSQVLNNLATNSGGANAGSGGGITITSNTTGSRQTVIHASTISGNQAAGLGGGLDITANTVIDQGSIISNNSGGTANIANTQNGGGIWSNTGNPDSVSLSKVTITGNSAAHGNGGGISVGSPGGTHGTLSMQFSRLAGNTALAGSNLNNIDGTVTATNNWWGTNTPAPTINNVTTTASVDPFIVLSNTANPNPIKLGQSTILTASFLQDNHGTAISASNLDVLLGLPLTFSNPILGTLSNAQEAIQPVDIATATESGSTVTITTAIAHGYSPGDTVVIAGVGVAGYNGTFTIASTPTATEFTYTNPTTGLAASSGGTASVPSAGASGTATAKFQSTLAGTGHADATVDTNPPPTVTASFTIQKGDTTTALTSSVNPSVFGQAVTFTATVSPVAPAGPPTTAAPTGTVTFLDGGSPIGTGTVNSVTGIATFTTSALSVGNHTITASYAGDSNYNGSTGSLTGNPQVVNKADTATTVTSSVNPSVFGQSVTFTATVSAVAPGAGTPTGTVTFLDGGSPIGTGTLSGGVATFTTSALAVGNHTITTNYGGDGNFNGSTGSLTGNPQVVNKADTATTVTSSANPSVFGQSVTFTATVSAVAPGSGTPTGTVTFLDGGSPIGTGTLSGGIATFTTSALAVGNHTITTSYGGDGNFNGSTGSLTGNPQVVNKANTATTVTSSVNPSVFGQSVTFTATVSPVAPGAGTPVGTVTFLDGGSPIGSGTLSGGIATFTTSALAVGNHTITTNYGGDGNFNGSTGSLIGNPQVVNKADTTTTVNSSLNPSVFGQSVTFTATVSAVAPGAGTPIGTVTFLDGGSPIGTGTLSGGIATFTTSALTGGSHTITTSYGGDGNFNGSTGSLTGNPQVVNKADSTTTVASSVNPSVFGQSVTFTAVVTAVAPGAGTPMGTVTFLDGGSPIGTGTLSGGIAAFTTSALAVGNHTITTAYGGDGNFNGSSGSLAGNPQVVNTADTTTAVISSLNPSFFGQSVTFTATVSAVAPGSGTPGGTVTFLDGGSPIGTGTLSGGIAAFTTSGLALGNHTITTSYGGDGNFNGSTGSLTGNPQVVTLATTTTTLTSSAGTITLGDTVTFTATVSSPGTGTPSGLVTFFDGSTPIGSGLLSSAQTTFPTSLLAVGSHSITAIYQGDADFAASPLTSPITVTVNLRGSTTSLGLNPTTVSAGQASTTTVTVTDAGASTPPGTPDVFTATGAPATGRTGFTATFIADGAVVITGGTDANGVVLKSAEVYSGGNFSPVPGNLNTARTGAVAVLLANAKVLIVGGSSNGGANGALNSAELLDLNTGTFAPTSHNMTAARFGTTATLLNSGKVLIAGGVNGGGVVNSAELYDPATDTFTATGNLNAARTGASATLLGTGKVLVAGGSSDGTATGALNSAEVFDPAGNAGAGKFTSVAGVNPILSDSRWQPEAALLLSGKVLVAGGQDSGGPLTTADLYDPAADSFTASAHQMNEARANGSAVALPSGMVLFAGGTTSQNVDLYDADNDQFNTTGSVLHHDRGLVATLLNNGQVLVVGLNIDNDPTDVSDAELYSPSFNPLGTIAFGSSDGTDVFGSACVLSPSTSTASTCTSTVTPIHVGTSPHTITGTYPADPVHSGSSNTASLTVIPTAPPTIAKAFSAANVGQNSKVNVSFTIVNPNGAATLTGLSFTDALPAGLVVATPNNLNNSCGGTVTAVPGSSSISLTGGTEGPSGGPPPCVITVDLLVTGTGTISNTTGPVSANESGPGNVSNTATLQVVLAPTVNKAFGAASIPLNGTTSLTFNIANPNTSTTLVGIALSDTLPSGLVVATPNGLTGTCVASSLITANAGSNSISLSALNLAATGSCSFSVNVKGTSGGTKNNTSGPITGTFDDGSGTFIVISGGTASASLAVVLPPSIAKAFNPTAIAPNGVSTLTFTITNPAANTVPENGVAVTDVLPSGLVVATPNGLVNNCGGTATATAGSGTISLSGGTVATSSSCVLSVNVTAAAAGTYNNTTGAISSTNGGTGNTASASLTVATASLSITKTHTGNFNRGQTGTYTITVSSSATAGPTLGTVTVTDTLPNVPNPLVATGLSGTGWTCTLGTLTCTRSDSLAAGASYPAITLTVNVPINIQANVTNSATVSGGGDPNSHTANDPTHIGAPIQITVNSGTATVTRGQSANFSMTVDSSPGLGNITFSCSGQPSGTLCTFNPASEGQLSATVTLTVTTAGPSSSSAAPMFRGGPTYALLFPALGLVGLVFVGNRGKKNRKTRLRWAMALSGLVLLLALAGCGGRPSFAGTPPGTYTITVTGSNGTTSGSAPVTMIVQ